MTAPPAGPEIITFGCRLNAYESEVMREHARSQGLTWSDFAGFRT